jgi:hypothetical protein
MTKTLHGWAEQSTRRFAEASKRVQTTEDPGAAKKSQLRVGRVWIVASTWRVEDQKDERSQDDQDVASMGLTSSSRLRLRTNRIQTTNPMIQTAKDLWMTKTLHGWAEQSTRRFAEASKQVQTTKDPGAAKKSQLRVGRVWIVAST